MEVILKKVKVTKSILDQSLIAGLEQIPNLQPLGWVMKKSKLLGFKKMILLYDEKKGVLFLIPPFSSVKVEKNNTYGLGDKCYAVHYNAPNFITQITKVMLEEEAKELATKIQTTINFALAQGQIYY